MNTLLTATPGQTVGPFFGYALPFDRCDQLVPAGSPGAVQLSGLVLDGDGQPVPDALLEIWQANADGTYSWIPDVATGDAMGVDWNSLQQVDSLPGPSELMVIADGTARPDFAAADLLAQAEHGAVFADYAKQMDRLDKAVRGHVATLREALGLKAEPS